MPRRPPCVAEKGKRELARRHQAAPLLGGRLRGATDDDGVERGELAQHPFKLHGLGLVPAAEEAALGEEPQHHPLATLRKVGERDPPLLRARAEGALAVVAQHVAEREHLLPVGECAAPSIAYGPKDLAVVELLHGRIELLALFRHPRVAPLLGVDEWRGHLSLLGGEGPVKVLVDIGRLLEAALCTRCRLHTGTGGREAGSEL